MAGRGFQVVPRVEPPPVKPGVGPELRPHVGNGSPPLAARGGPRIPGLGVHPLPTTGRVLASFGEFLLTFRSVFGMFLYVFAKLK